MKILVQWSKAVPEDWQTLDAATWMLTPQRVEPVGGEVLDDAPGWVNRLNVQGVDICGYDHYAVEPLLDGGCRVTVWKDDPDDLASDVLGEFYARVITFLPLAPDVRLGGAYNTRQSQVVYAGPKLTQFYLDNPTEHTEIRPWAEFVPPVAVTRHGIWVSDLLMAAHDARLSRHGWREWIEEVPAEEIVGGELRPQRPLGRYDKPTGTKTFGLRDTDLANGIYAANHENQMTRDAFGAGETEDLVLAGFSAGRMLWTTVTGEPDNADWPSGNYRCQLDCSAAGADVSYRIGDNGTTGLFGRVNSGLTSDLQTWQQIEAAFTGTGLKLATTGTIDPTAGAAGDRFECLCAFFRAASHGNQTTTLRYSADAFADGPWTVAGTLSLTVGAAAVLLKQVTAQVGTHAVIQRQNIPASVGVSAVLAQRFTVGVGAASVLRKTEADTVGTGAVLLKQNISSTVGASAVVQKTNTAVVGGSAVVQTTVLTTVGADAQLSAAGVKIVGAGAVVQKQGITAVVGAGAVVQKRGITATVGTSAVLRKTETNAVGASAVLRKQGITIGVGATTVLRKTETAAVGAAAAIARTEIGLTVGADAQLLGVATKVVNAAAVLLKQGLTTATGASAVLQRTAIPITVGATAQLSGAGTKVVGANAVLLRQGIGSVVATAAVLRATETVTVGATAVLQKQGLTTATGAGAVLRKTTTAVVGAAATIQRTGIGFTVGATALLVGDNTKVVGANAVLRQTVTAQVGTSAVLRATEVRTAAVSAVLRKTAALGVGVTAVLASNSRLVGASAVLLQQAVIATVGVNALLIKLLPFAVGMFSVALADATGTRIIGSERRLVPGPTRVEYPTTAAGSILETAGGRAIRQQPTRDNRQRSWLWMGYPEDLSGDRYRDIWNLLQSLRSRYRKLYGAATPYVYLRDSISQEFRRQQVFTGAATAGTATTLTDAQQAWTTDELFGHEIEIISGTGAGQVRKITANTQTQITIGEVWSAPDTTSVYAVRGWINDWFRARVIDVVRIPATAGGNLRFEETRFVFVVDDLAFNHLG